MSYMAEAIMKQNMSPEDFQRNVYGNAAPAEQPAGPVAAAATPEERVPEPSQPLSQEGAANIEKERQRFQTAGYDAESRTLGGPRGKLGG